MCQVYGAESPVKKEAGDVAASPGQWEGRGNWVEAGGRRGERPQGVFRRVDPNPSSLSQEAQGGRAIAVPEFCSTRPNSDQTVKVLGLKKCYAEFGRERAAPALHFLPAAVAAAL
jgi:hypothetical protein